jgi:hypothetical protein
MPTIITKTIGSTGDYATPQLWANAIPADLVSADESHVGHLQNENFSGSGTRLTISGKTTDATHTIMLMTAPDCSFRDHPNRRTNALRVDTTYGATLTETSGFAPVVVLSSVDYVTIRGVQMQNTGSVDTSNNCVTYIGAATHNVLEYCVLEAKNNSTFVGVVRWRAGVVRNCLVINRNGGSGVGFACDFALSLTIVGCTIVRPSNLAVASNGITTDQATVTVRNCAVFGFTNFVNTVGSFTGSNNASDVAVGFGTNNVGPLIFTDQFQVTVNTNSDFRLKDTSGCLDHGVTDATHGTPDISGTPRPGGTFYCIGCWEVIQDRRNNPGVIGPAIARLI